MTKKQIKIQQKYNQVSIKKWNIPIQNKDKKKGEEIKTERANQCKKRSLKNSRETNTSRTKEN